MSCTFTKSIASIILLVALSSVASLSLAKKDGSGKAVSMFEIQDGLGQTVGPVIHFPAAPGSSGPADALVQIDGRNFAVGFFIGIEPGISFVSDFEPHPFGLLFEGINCNGLPYTNLGGFTVLVEGEGEQTFAGVGRGAPPALEPHMLIESNQGVVSHGVRPVMLMVQGGDFMEVTTNSVLFNGTCADLTESFTLPLLPMSELVVDFLALFPPPYSLVLANP